VRSPNEIAEEHLNIATERLGGYLKSDFPPETCPRLIRSGDSAEEISLAAAEQGFDLVMMPTHAGRFRRTLLGSTAAKILDEVTCPVLTDQHSEVNAPRPLEHRVWVCAIGLSADSERVLRLAAESAAEVGARLCVVHAARGGAEVDARVRIEELVEATRCKADIEVVSGPLKEALLCASARRAADVLIVGRRLHDGVVGRLRDLTYSLIRDSPVPVLSV
jgi:nucleotide-binding universal stress UspA family protein